MKQATLFLILASALMAAEPPAESTSFTLDEALVLAERHHPSLAEGRALVAAAEGRAQQAGSFPNPEAIARVEAAPLRSRSGDAEYLAGAAQTVPLGPRLAKARAAEQLEREKHVHALEARRRELRKRVHAAFATALYQDAAFTTQSNITQTFAAAVRVTNARVAAGDALPDDLARVELELARSQVELARIESMSQVALRSLAAAVGAPAIAGKRPEGKLDEVFDLPAMERVSAILAQHPALLEAGADVRTSEARIALARAQRIPDLTIEALYRRLQADRRDAIDIGVSIPLPIFDRNQGRVREARAEVAAAEARRQTIRTDLELRSQQAHAQFAVALAQSRALREKVLPRAETILHAAERRYAAGDARLSDLLPIRREWAAAQLTYLESLRDVAQAWGQLKTFMPDLVDGRRSP